MKTTSSFCAAALSFAALNPAAFAQLPAVAFNETSAEFTGRADLDGNGLPDVILVDKISGSVRIAYQLAAGSFSWDEPKASGIGDVTGVTAGHLLLATKDALAVTGPEANRINLLTPSLGGAVVPQPIFIAPIGPMTIVAANLAGSIAVDDLWVGSAFNSAPSPSRFDQYLNSPAGTFALHANRHVSAGAFDSANAVVAKTSLTGTIAYMERLPAGDTLRIISASEAGAPVRVTLGALPAGSEYLIAPFAGATLANVLTSKPGDSAFSSRTLSEPVLGTFAMAAPVSFPLPFPVGQMMLVPTTATATKLLVMSPDGLTAAYFDFSGSALSTALGTLSAPSGEQFTGGVALPGFAGFQLLRGPLGDGRTATARSMKWNASTGHFDDLGGTSFGVIGKRSGTGNVLVFSGEPMVSPTATLLSRLNARDWSSGLAPVPPAALNLIGEVFTSDPQGLRSALPVSLGAAPAGATNVLLNQYRPYLSLFSASPAAGATIGEPFIAPDGGPFFKTVQLSFTMPTGMIVQFRDAGGTWITYAPPGAQPPQSPGNLAYEAWWTQFQPLLRFKNTVIEYYGQVGLKRSVIKHATFNFTAGPESLSSLNDGVPDYVKLGLHYNPLLPPPNLLGTEQGSFLNRLLGGVANQRILTPSAFDLLVRPMALNGLDNANQPSLLVGLLLPDGTTNAGNEIIAHDAGGALLAGDDDDGSGPPLPVPPLPPLPPYPAGLRAWPVPTFSKPGPPPVAYDPSARLSRLSGEGNGGFAILATKANFAIGGTMPASTVPSAIGREMVGLIPLPAIPGNAFRRLYGGGTDAAEANTWVTEATNFYNAATLPSHALTLDVIDTMGVLVMERWLLLRCVERGLLPASYAPPIPNVSAPPPLNPNYLTLTAFRTNEAAKPLGVAPTGAVSITASQLQSLQVAAPPTSAFRLTDVVPTLQTTLRTSADPDITMLRNVVRDVYRISSSRANTVRGGFESPVEALRNFLAIGAVSPAYGNTLITPPLPDLPLPGAPYSTLSNSQYASARVGLDKILNTITERPYADFDLLVRADSLQPACTLLDNPANGLQLSLVNFDGQPFHFPSSFTLTPGTKLHVTAYTDLPNGPCGPVVEVVNLANGPAAQIIAIPTPTPLSGGNLLPDAWEMFFFGQIGVDPFASPPGSNLSYLQLYLDGKDPLNPASYNGLQPVLLKLPIPSIDAAPNGLSFHLHFSLPPAYANSFAFTLQSATELSAFMNTPQVFQQTQPGEFELDLTGTGTGHQFWRIGFALK